MQSILTINGGSSSIKFALYRPANRCSAGCMERLIASA